MRNWQAQLRRGARIGKRENWSVTLVMRLGVQNQPFVWKGVGFENYVEHV